MSTSVSAEETQQERFLQLPNNRYLVSDDQSSFPTPIFGGGGSQQFWFFETNLAPPPHGNVYLNDTDPSLVTSIVISWKDIAGSDATLNLSLNVGTRIRISRIDDPNQYGIYQLDAGSFSNFIQETFTHPVTYLAGSGEFENGGDLLISFSEKGDTGPSGLTLPGSSTDHAITRWDGAAGDAIQDSLVTIADDGTMTVQDVEMSDLYLLVLGQIPTHLAAAAAATDKLVATKLETLSGFCRAGLLVAEWAGVTSPQTNTQYGANCFSYVNEDATQDMTKTGDPGGLTGNRVAARIRPTSAITVAYAVGCASTIDIQSGTSTVTKAVGYLVEEIKGRSGTIAEANGILIRDADGATAIFFGIRIEEPSNYSADGEAIFIENAGRVRFRDADIAIGSNDDGRLDLSADTSIDMNDGTSFDSNGDLVVQSYNDAGRPTAGTAGRIIFNTDDGQLNIDDGAQWTLPDGSAT